MEVKTCWDNIPCRVSLILMIHSRTINLKFTATGLQLNPKMMLILPKSKTGVAGTDRTSRDQLFASNVFHVRYAIESRNSTDFTKASLIPK